MEDLLPSQIQDSCKLALPEGLKDLMSDISREVLRCQPRNLYQFIANYLSALLITRDNLSVAGYICTDICQCSCEPELQSELLNLGLPEDEVKTARDIIVNYFDKGPVHEYNLFMRLIKETTIDEDMMPAVQTAIRNAFLRHQAHNTTIYESSSNDEDDEMMCAAKHTLNLYRKTAPSEKTYELMAQKIQESYRAYGVRRQCESKHYTHASQNKSADKSVNLAERRSQRSSSYDIAFPKTTYGGHNSPEESVPEDPEIALSTIMNQSRLTTISSTSLAGSFLALPSHKPYSAHDCEHLSDLEEIPEREHAYIDYTAENPHMSMVSENKLVFKRESSKKISFSDSQPDEAKMMALGIDDDSESKNSNVEQNESSMEADTDMFYGSDIMKVDSKNYDGDTEMERSNFDFDEICDDFDV